MRFIAEFILGNVFLIIKKGFLCTSKQVHKFTKTTSNHLQDMGPEDGYRR